MRKYYAVMPLQPDFQSYFPPGSFFFLKEEELVGVLYHPHQLKWRERQRGAMRFSTGSRGKVEARSQILYSAPYSLRK